MVQLLVASASPVLSCRMNIRALGFPFLFLFSSIHAQSFDWAFSLDGQGARGMAMVTDEAGNVYVCGNVNGIADFDPGPDEVLNVSAGINGDNFLAKYGPSGNYIWHLCVGGSGTEIPKGLALDHNGDLVMVGRFDSFFDWDPGMGDTSFGSVGSTDGFIAKYDTSGAFIWATHIGGGGSDETFGVAVDEDNAIYVTGWMSGTVDFDNGPNSATLVHEGGTWDAYCAKYDVDGQFVWTRGIQGTGSQRGMSIAYQGGHVFAYGVFGGDTHAENAVATSAQNNAQSYLCKMDLEGHVLWLRGHGGTGNEAAEAIRADATNLYIMGAYYGVTDADPGPGVIELQPNTNGGNNYFAKLDTAGNALWAHGVQANNHFDGVCDIAYDNEGNTYVTSAYSEVQDFGPGPGESILPMTIANDLYLAKYDTDGGFVWARSIATVGVFDTANGLATDLFGNVYVTGSFGDTAVFNTTAPTDTLTGTSFTGFVAKYGTDINTGSPEHLATPEMSVFPNPTSEQITIRLPNGTIAERMLLTDATGRILQRWAAPVPRQFSTVRLPAGTYHVHIWSGGQRTSTGFVVLH